MPGFVHQCIWKSKGPGHLCIARLGKRPDRESININFSSWCSYISRTRGSGFDGIWRVELYGEGGMVGWLIKTAVGVRQNDPPGVKTPSGDGITLQGGRG